MTLQIVTGVPPKIGATSSDPIADRSPSEEKANNAL
jgi:hypothetical protein